MSGSTRSLERALPARDAAVPADSGMNTAMVLAYDGSPYQGWQIQPHGPTVQGTLEKALGTILRHPVRVIGSGRTDTGVHARNQVANVFLPEPPSLYRLRQQINALAGPSIAVKRMVEMPPNFHARYCARGKHYRYHVFNRPYPPVFGRERCWWIRQELDVDAMREAAGHLVGEHDFSAFRAKACEAPSPVRKIRRIEITAGEREDSTLRIDLEASAFLQHMARIVVGTLVAVGLGRLEAATLGAILASRDRERAAATAPASGLHLISVQYDLEEFPQLAPMTDEPADL